MSVLNNNINYIIINWFLHLIKPVLKKEDWQPSLISVRIAFSLAKCGQFAIETLFVKLIG